jgi:hypothetical protein
MNQRMIQEQIVKEIYPLKSNSQLKKEVRIATLVPVVSMRKLWLPKGNFASKRELLHEMDMMTREASLSQHDDGVDCLASFTEQGFVVYPGEYRGSEVAEGELYDLGDYQDNYF